MQRSHPARATSRSGSPMPAVGGPRGRRGHPAVAVSKTHPRRAITPLIEAGCGVFGENRGRRREAKRPRAARAVPDVALHPRRPAAVEQGRRGGRAVRRDPFARPAEPRRRACQSNGTRPAAKSPASSRSTSAPRSRRAASPSPSCRRCSPRRAPGSRLAGADVRAAVRDRAGSGLRACSTSSPATTACPAEAWA